MEINLDWQKILETASIGGALIFLIYVGFQGFKLMIKQWESSTEAVNKNTEAFTKLSGVFEKSSEREERFQTEAIDLLRDNVSISRETNRRVKDLQEFTKGESVNP